MSIHDTHSMQCTRPLTEERGTQIGEAGIHFRSEQVNVTSPVSEPARITMNSCPFRPEVEYRDINGLDSNLISIGIIGTALVLVLFFVFCVYHFLEKRRWKREKQAMREALREALREVFFKFTNITDLSVG